MKIDRLIGIITVLLQQQNVTAVMLAERFEVSRRTINRDIEDICKAGIPIVTTRGYGGGISIAEGYKIDKSVLKEEELQAILCGLKGFCSVSNDTNLANVMDKLSLKSRLTDFDDIISIDLSSHYRGTIVEKIEVLKGAIIQSKLVKFVYYSQKGDSVRLVEPYRIIFKWTSWYLLGYCTLRKDFRLFKLNRLWGLKITNDSFIIRETAEISRCPDNYFDGKSIHLKALFSPSEKYRLIDENGIDCYTVTADGLLLYEWDFVSYDYMREWVFSFGDKVRILEPESLIEDRLNQSRKITQQVDNNIE